MKKIIMTIVLLAGSDSLLFPAYLNQSFPTLVGSPMSQFLEKFAAGNREKAERYAVLELFFSSVSSGRVKVLYCVHHKKVNFTISDDQEKVKKIVFNIFYIPDDSMMSLCSSLNQYRTNPSAIVRFKTELASLRYQFDSDINVNR